MGVVRRRSCAVLLTASLALVTGAVQAWAQSPITLPPFAGGRGEGEPTPVEEPTTTTTGSTTTPTTEAPRPTLVPPVSSTPTTSGPGDTVPDDTSSTVPGDGTGNTIPGDAGAPTDPDGDGDGGSGAGMVPPSAQAVIDAIARTAPNDNSALVDGVAALEAAGVPHDEAVRLAYGRFPIQGPSRWVDDWYFPRWTGSTFRFHQGLDMFAAYGTPVAAPVDGVAQIGNNALGGLTVRVVEPDGTYWYLAHLSGLADGLVNGQAVTVGEVVGYVGDSGNARGTSPHLHFGVYVRGVAVPPKPYVDAWVLEGAQRVVDVLAIQSAAPQPAAVVAAEITRQLSEGVFANPAAGPTGPPRSELLWASAANPAGGSVQLAEAAAAAVNEAVDWEQRAAQEAALDLAWARAADDARRALAPLTNRFLRQAGERARADGGPVVVGAP